MGVQNEKNESLINETNQFIFEDMQFKSLIYKIKDENEQLKNEIEQLKTETEQFKDSIDKLNDEIEKLKNETEKIKIEKKELKMLIENQNEESEKLRNEIDKFNIEKEESKKNVTNLEKELNNRINIIGQEKDELKNLTNKIKEENDELKNRVKIKENEINELKNNNNYLENKENEIKNEKEERNKYYNNLFLESNIIKKDERKLISKWILPHYNLKFELLYKGSRDGYTNDIFHSKCDNKGPTVFVAKLENNRRFGGFTSDPWKDGVIGMDDKAFLFSLDNKIKYGPKKKGIRTTYSQTGSSVLFGPNIDLDYKQDDLPIVNNIVYCRNKGAKFNFVIDDITGGTKIALKEYEVYLVKNYVNY